MEEVAKQGMAIQEAARIRSMHTQVPKDVDLKAKFHRAAAAEGSAAGGTTGVIRNSRNRYTWGMFMEELGQLGFEDAYDFVYMPMDEATHWNVGPAFKSFLDAASTGRRIESLMDYRFKKFRRASSEVGQGFPAPTQERTALESLGWGDSHSPCAAASTRHRGQYPRGGGSRVDPSGRRSGEVLGGREILREVKLELEGLLHREP